MGAKPAQTVTEIEETRERLEDEFGELQRRLPAPALWAKRVVGVAVGGGTGGTVFWFVARRLRRRNKAKEEARQVKVVVSVLPDAWAKKLTEALQDNRWRQWAAVAFSGWALVRLAELRQLRRMNKALLAKAA